MAVRETDGLGFLGTVIMEVVPPSLCSFFNPFSTPFQPLFTHDQRWYPTMFSTNTSLYLWSSFFLFLRRLHLYIMTYTLDNNHLFRISLHGLSNHSDQTSRDCPKLVASSLFCLNLPESP